MKKDLQPYRNVPRTTPTGGNPSRPSNAGLMSSVDRQEYYSAGYPEHRMLPVKVAAALALINADFRKRADAMIEEELEKLADLLPGGLADGKSPREYDPDELRKGIEIEKEHTDDETLAREIAKDHLEEIPDYYTRLERMEEEAEHAHEKRASAQPSAPTPQPPAVGAQPVQLPAAPKQSLPQQAPMPPGVTPTPKPQQSQITGMPKSPSQLFISQLRERLVPQQQQQQPKAAAQGVLPQLPQLPQPAPTQQAKPMDPPEAAPNTSPTVTAEKQQEESLAQGDTQASELPKTADTPTLLWRQHNLLITPDGKVIVRRLPNRRFALPEGAMSRLAPYEDSIRFLPSEGVPEEGFHGYDIGLGLGEAGAPEEGFEAAPAADVLRDLYASMGIKANRPWRDVDRQRARVLLRVLRKRKREV